jgi:hypothetical protein
MKRKQLQGKQSPKHVCGVYFDGRKDRTMMNIQEGGKHYRITVTKEHYSLVQEPGSSYLGQVTLIVFGELVAIRCDGTNVNTGKIGGVKIFGSRY